MRDTLHIVERDSVPYEVVRTETREVGRPLSWFDKIARAVFWIETGAVVIGVATWMAKKAGAKNHSPPEIQNGCNVDDTAAAFDYYQFAITGLPHGSASLVYEGLVGRCFSVAAAVTTHSRQRE